MKASCTQAVPTLGAPSWSTVSAFQLQLVSPSPICISCVPSRFQVASNRRTAFFGGDVGLEGDAARDGLDGSEIDTDNERIGGHNLGRNLWGQVSAVRAKRITAIRWALLGEQSLHAGATYDTMIREQRTDRSGPLTFRGSCIFY